MHGADLRSKFHDRWAGKDGRFQREIKKLERSFRRKCSVKNSVPRLSNYVPANSTQVSRRSIENSHELFAEISSENRERRSGHNEDSGGQLTVENNPGHRMRHIVRNVEKWTEDYLTGCNNQGKVTHRWQRFADKWENEMAKNPTFQEEFEQEAKYLREARAGPGQPCGRIYSEFGLHGKSLEVREGEAYGIGKLGSTDFGNDNVMSMLPFPGKYII